jgi:predicted Ser/Thr protein kinase
LLKQGAQTDGPAFEPPSVEEVRRLFPQLEVLTFIGKGGMGAVYKARQPALDRFVALKILPSQGGERGFAERFQREARALAKLNHPNIVAVHDFGQVDGFAFFVMELVDGLNLRELERAGRLTPREALKIVPQICEALQFAHDEGIVHRDIKPENILLDKKGRVKIADFGIAKIMGGDAGASVTETKHAIGTPHYMAPEQVEKPESVDHRADIFSLGVVFYEMLTGELPLGKFAPPSRKVEVDVRLDEVVLRALEKEPERRYQQANHVKTDVETVASSPPIPASAPKQQVFSYLALGLFLTGLLGTLLLLAMSHGNRAVAVAVCFGALALLTALTFGCLSWRQKLGKGVAVATMAIFVLLAITIGILSEVIPIPFVSERRRAAIEEARQKQIAKQEAQQMFHGVDSLPPVVVGTEPISGSRDVAPGITAIRVAFSKGMLPESWSWSTAWSNSAPEILGKPRFEADGRTCVVTTRLEPGRTYAFWLNSDQFHNFRDVDGRPAVPYLLIFETKQQ